MHLKTGRAIRSGDSRPMVSLVTPYAEISPPPLDERSRRRIRGAGRPKERANPLDGSWARVAARSVVMRVMTASSLVIELFEPGVVSDAGRWMPHRQLANHAHSLSSRGTGMSGAAETGGNRGPVVRIAVAVAALFTGWHLFASFLWISPPTPLRELVPGNLLTEYMIPWFGQSWSVFAPEPINGDYHLEVRAMVGSGEEAATTEWVDAVDVEWQMAHHNLFPPRAANLAMQQASDFRTAWSGLNEEQKRIATLNYFEGDDWLGREMAAMNSVGENSHAVTKFIVAERYTDAYATQVARAIWGDDVDRVQYRVWRQNIVPFEQRHSPSAVRPAPTYFTTGWRGLIVLPDQNETAFEETFLPLYEQYVSSGDN